MQRLVLQDRSQRLQFGLCCRQLLLGDVGETAPVPPRALEEGIRRRTRFPQHLVPASEARQGPIRHDPERRQHEHLFQGRVVDLRRRFPCRLDGLSTLAIRRRREPQEVDIVRIVGHRVETLRAALCDVVLVGLDRELVTPDRVGVAPDAVIDV